MLKAISVCVFTIPLGISSRATITKQGRAGSLAGHGRMAGSVHSRVFRNLAPTYRATVTTVVSTSGGACRKSNHLSWCAERGFAIRSSLKGSLAQFLALQTGVSYPFKLAVYGVRWVRLVRVNPQKRLKGYCVPAHPPLRTCVIAPLANPQVSKPMKIVF